MTMKSIFRAFREGVRASVAKNRVTEWGCPSEEDKLDTFEHTPSHDAEVRADKTVRIVRPFVELRRPKVLDDPKISKGQ